MAHRAFPGGHECDGHVSILRLDRSLLVVLSGDFDAFDAHGVAAACELALPAVQPVVLVDTTAVTFVDCGFLDAVDDLAAECELRGGWLSVVGAPTIVRRVCDLLGLGLLLDASGARHVSPIELPPVVSRTESPPAT